MPAVYTYIALQYYKRRTVTISSLRAALIMARYDMEFHQQLYRVVKVEAAGCIYKPADIARLTALDDTGWISVQRDVS